MSDNQEWVLVRSESELRAGMVVKVVDLHDSDTPGITIVRTLLTREASASFCNICGLCIGWSHSGSRFRGAMAVCRSIPEGRLYRLETGLDDEALQREGKEIYAPKKASKWAETES